MVFGFGTFFGLVFFYYYRGPASVVKIVRLSVCPSIRLLGGWLPCLSPLSTTFFLSLVLLMMRSGSVSAVAVAVLMSPADFTTYLPTPLLAFDHRRTTLGTVR